MRARSRYGMALLGFMIGCAGAGKTAVFTRTPGDVTASPVDRIVEVVAGPESTCARTAGGRVACLGQGMAYTEDEPALDTHFPQVVDVPPSRAISAGAGFACSIDREGGKVRCWGENQWHQLGRATPGSVDHWAREVPGLDGIERLVTHGDRTCALREDRMWCWPVGEDESVEERSIAGERPELALRKRAELWRSLELHQSPTRRISLDRSWENESRIPCPFAIPPEHDPYDLDDPYDRDACPGSDGVRLSEGMEVGMRHACLLAGDRVRCDGADTVGQAPRGGVDLGFSVADLAVGAEHTCGVTSGGDLYCWGSSSRGQIGLPPFDRREPVRVATDVDEAWVTRYLTCIRTRAGEHWCAGGSIDPCATPQLVPPSGPSGIREMVDGPDSPGCIVDMRGSIWCSLDGAWNELVPADLLAGPAASRSHFTSNGRELCWLAAGRPTCATWRRPREGLDEDPWVEERRAQPDTETPASPERLAAPHEPFGAVNDIVQLSWLAGALCTVDRASRLRCLQPRPSWGDPTEPMWDEVRVPEQPVEAISPDGFVLAGGAATRVFATRSGDFGNPRPWLLGQDIETPTVGRIVEVGHACALLDSGQLWCDDAQTRLPPGERVRDLVTTDSHACAIDDGRDLWCWGDATWGQLGGGEPMCSRRPRALSPAFQAAWEAAR